MFYFLNSIKFENSDLDLFDCGHNWIAKSHQDLIKQIESPVKWRETVINMINSDVKKFIEIGPGKFYLDL